VLLVAAAFAERQILSLPLVILTAAIGGFAGDQAYFYLGHRYGEPLLRRFPRIARKVDRVRALLFRFRRPIIPAMRFMYGFRLVGPFALGASRVEPLTFLWLNALGAVVWSIALGTLGFGLARTFWSLKLDRYEYAFAGVFILAVALLIWHRRR